MIRAARPDDTTLPAFALTMDKLLRVDLEGAVEPLMLHFEVAANWASAVPRTTFDYWSLAHRAYDELQSVVVCLKPGAKQGDPRGVYERRVRGRVLVRFEFDVICLWKLAADDVLARAKPGVLPFVPFTAGVTRTHVDQALGRLASVEPVRRRGDLQAALVVFADNLFPDVDWTARIPEELLMTSRLFQTAYGRGELAGQLAGQRNLLGRILTRRLGAPGEALIARLQLASEEQLTQASDLVAAKLSDAELVARLDELLPPAE